MVQTFYDVDIKFDISKNVFIPKPQVDSSLIKFKTKKNKINYNLYSLFIKECFKQRRKKIKNNLKGNYDIKLLGKFSEKRVEQISVENFINLYNKICIWTIN